MYTLPAPTPTNPNPLTWPVPEYTVAPSSRHNTVVATATGNRLLHRIQKTVIRAGFNVFDDHNAFTKDAQDARGSWPAGGQTIASGLNRQVRVLSWTILLPRRLSWKVEPRSSGAPEILTVRFLIPCNIISAFGESYTNSTSLQITYVGSVSRRFWETVGYNAPLPQNMGTNAQPAGEPFPFINGTIQGGSRISSGAISNAIQGQLQRRFAQGLQFMVSYTCGSCSEELSMGESSTRTHRTLTTWLPIMVHANKISLSYSSSVGFIPCLSGEASGLARGSGKGMNFLIGGSDVDDWDRSKNSGVDFTAGVSADNANTGTPSRTNYVPGCQLKPSGFKQTVGHWYNTDCFVVPPEYTFGATERNGFRGPDYNDFESLIFKNFEFR